MTSSRQSRELVADTNHESLRHKSRSRLSRLCREVYRQLSPFIVTDQIPLQRHKRVCGGLVTDFVANISTCRDGLCP